MGEEDVTQGLSLILKRNAVPSTQAGAVPHRSWPQKMTPGAPHIGDRKSGTAFHRREENLGPKGSHGGGQSSLEHRCNGSGLGGLRDRTRRLSFLPG